MRLSGSNSIGEGRGSLSCCDDLVGSEAEIEGTDGGVLPGASSGLR